MILLSKMYIPNLISIYIVQMLPKLVTIISIFNDIFYSGHNNVTGAALNVNVTANFFDKFSPNRLQHLT